MAAFCWSDIIKKLGVKSTYMFDLLTMSVSAIGRKIPGFVFHAIGRLLIYNAISVSKVQIAIGMVVETVIYAICGLTSILLISSNYNYIYNWMRNPSVLLFVNIIIIIVVIILGPKVIHLILRITNNERYLAELKLNNPFRLVNVIQWFVYGIIVIFLSSGTVYFIFKSVMDVNNIPFTSILTSFGFTLFIGPFAVWLPTDIGLQDGILYLLIKPYVSPSTAALLTLISRIWLSLLTILFGLISGIFLNQKIKLINIFKK